MSEQDEPSEQPKYSLHIEQPQGLVIGDDPHVTNNFFRVVEPPSAGSTSSKSSLPPVTREELLRAVHTASTELRDYPHEIAGEHLTRPEVTEILGWVVSADPKEKLGMILDLPGGGKTVVMRDVLVSLEDSGIPVLAIKADTLSGVEDVNELRHRLDLPMSVEDCARFLAQEGLVVVIVDQIDALSMVLSRDQDTLNTILSALSRLRGIPNVRIVASCRTFDLRHDPRLSSIKVDKEFDLRALTEEQVNNVLRRLDVDPARLLPEHESLLTVPLHLSLYAQVMADMGASPATESFRTLQELYEALWRKRIEAVPPETPQTGERIEAIYALVDAMRGRSQLTAPLAVLDAYATAARYLEQIAFIRRERGNFLFAHQTLFDYCYARRFVAAGRSISADVLDGEQGLFERSQMIHVLAYLRGADENMYRRELAALMFAEGLRVHLRLLLMNWFGSLTKPTENEFRIAQRLMATPEGCTQFLSSAAGNEDWFDVLNAGSMERLFRLEDAKAINVFYWFLGSVIEKRVDQVVDLLRPYLGRSEEWNSRVIFVLDRLSNWKSEKALTLLCDVLRQRGTSAGREYLLSLHHLASSNPAGGCRAVRALLDRRVEEMLAEEAEEQGGAEAGGNVDEETDFRRALRRGRLHWNESLFGEHSINEVLQKAVADCPREIVAHLLPWFVRTIQVLTVKTDGESDETDRETYAWDALFATGWYGDYLNESAVFSNRIMEALRHVAKTAPDEFRRLAQELTPIDSMAIHRALANAYLAAPETYAGDIAEYLMGDRRRLTLGEHEEPEYDSRRLYGVAFGLVDEEQRLRLEDLILSHKPQRESRGSEAGYDYCGLTQLKFLKSVPNVELLSEAARGRLQELEEKFLDLELKAPEGMVVRDVVPPVSPEVLAVMSDDELLEAMRKYNDTYRPSERDEFFTGGVLALAYAIGERAKTEPERIFTLTRRFDDSISFKYVLAIISALANTPDLPPEWLFEVVRRFSNRITHSDRQAISHALAARAAASVPDDLVDLLSDWALHDPDPEGDSWAETDRYGNRLHQGDPHSQGINSTRGIALESAVKCAILPEPSQVERSLNLLEEAARDSTTAVRSCVVQALDWMLYRGEDDRVLEIFERAMDGHPRLLQVPVTHRLLYRSYFLHFNRVHTFIERLLVDRDDNTRQMGASLACLASFKHEEAGDLESRAMTGDHVMRRGAAQVYARQLGDPRYEDICRERLRTLMQDEDEDVLTSVGVCFKYARLEQFESLRGFIEEFLNSPALLPGAQHLVKYFKQIAADEHDLTLNVTERILDEGGDDLFTVKKNRVLDDTDLVALPLTVYTHANNREIKNRAIELFERLLLKGSYAAQRALNDWDRK
jgi:hypothetical protein